MPCAATSKRSTGFLGIERFGNLRFSAFRLAVETRAEIPYAIAAE
jgi:hypothetical protein